MNRIRLALMVGFAVAFAAGGSVGMLLAPAGPSRSGSPPPASQPGSPTERRRGPGASLAHELKLTAEQREKMRRIWSNVMGKQAGLFRERGESLRRRRDESIVALLTGEQRSQYEQILADYKQGWEEIHRERHRLIEQAVEQTKEILTEEQARKYEEIRKRGRSKRGERPGPPFGPFRRGRGGGPSTRPGRRDRPDGDRGPVDDRGRETDDRPAPPRARQRRGRPGAEAAA